MIRRGALFVLALALLVGCTNVARPRLLHPGTADTQQRRAEAFDPFPLPELGPPTEARPRGFLLPEPDTERMQNAGSYQERFGTAPPPGVYRAPRQSSRQALPFVPAPAFETPQVFVP